MIDLLINLIMCIFLAMTPKSMLTVHISTFIKIEFQLVMCVVCTVKT